MQNLDCVVVGGGIVGLSCALALQRAGFATTLIDPDGEVPAASWGNAGHVAIEQVEPLASVATLRSAFRRLTALGGPLGLPPSQVRNWAPFAARLARAAAPESFVRGKAALSGLLAEAMPAWERLAVSLPRPDLLQQKGHIVAWHDPAAATRGLASWRAADTGTARFREASPDELAGLGRVLARPPAGAIVFSNSGQVTDPGAVLLAMREAFARGGGTTRKAAVRSIEPEAGAAVLRLETGEAIAARRVLLAAGVRSGALLKPLGLAVPIIAERGYHIQAANHGWPADLPPVAFEERSTIVTRFESGLRVAGFVEFGAVDAPPNPKRWERLEAHAKALGLPVEGPFARWSGARPTLPDYLPAIGRVRNAPGLFYAFGHQHLGLTLAPVTGELVAALMQEQPGAVDLKPFDVGRFARRG